MGESFEFRCSECGYATMVSGGRDVGMIAVVKTQVCLDCKKVVDVQIGSYGRDGPTGDPQLDEDLDICPECKGRKLSPCPTRHPCPKCGGKMIKDADTVVRWD